MRQTEHISVFQAKGPHKLMLFDQPNFSGRSLELTDNMKAFEEKWLRHEVQSCKVLQGSWVFFEHPNFCGRQYLLEKGEYRHHSEWGALKATVASIKKILELWKDFYNATAIKVFDANVCSCLCEAEF